MGIEKRQEDRYNVALLPASMKQYYIRLSPDLEVIADIKDASLSGLGLIVPLDSMNFIVGLNIAIYPIGKDYALYGKIAHVSSIGENKSRVGIKLKNTMSLEKYRKILSESQL